MGEYARSLAIARAARARWDIAVHFAISRDAPYAADAPFEQTLLPASPTFHSAELIALMEKFRPDVVIFDNAGRTAQLRAAARLGARVVFISARARQRRKAFRWRWMPLIDEHWIAYPQFIAGALRPVERFKLRLIGRPMVRYLDVLIEACLLYTSTREIPRGPPGSSGSPSVHRSNWCRPDRNTANPRRRPRRAIADRTRPRGPRPRKTAADR